MTPKYWTLSGKINQDMVGRMGQISLDVIYGRSLLLFFSCGVANQLLFDTQMQINFEFKILKACYQREL